MGKFDHIGRIYFESESCSVVFKSLRLHGLYSPWNSAGQNTGVDSLSLLQGSFPTQGLNLGFSHCRWIIYQLSYKRIPHLLFFFFKFGGPPKSQMMATAVMKLKDIYS